MQLEYLALPTHAGGSTIGLIELNECVELFHILAVVSFVGMGMFSPLSPTLSRPYPKPFDPLEGIWR